MNYVLVSASSATMLPRLRLVAGRVSVNDATASFSDSACGGGSNRAVGTCALGCVTDGLNRPAIGSAAASKSTLRRFHCSPASAAAGGAANTGSSYAAAPPDSNELLDRASCTHEIGATVEEQKPRLCCAQAPASRAGAMDPAALS